VLVDGGAWSGGDLAGAVATLAFCVAVCAAGLAFLAGVHEAVCVPGFCPAVAGWAGAGAVAVAASLPGGAGGVHAAVSVVLV